MHHIHDPFNILGVNLATFRIGLINDTQKTIRAHRAVDVHHKCPTPGVELYRNRLHKRPEPKAQYQDADAMTWADSKIIPCNPVNASLTPIYLIVGEQKAETKF